MHYFFARVGPLRIPQKRVGIPCAEHVFLRLVVSVGHVLFMLGRDWYGFHKKHTGTCYAEVVFCIRWDLWVTEIIAVCPGRETLTDYFSCLGETGMDSRKSASRHITSNV
jgi:hypothetical protein